MASLEQQLLDMADVLEKTAAESEESIPAEVKKDHEESESKKEEKDEKKDDEKEDKKDEKKDTKKEAVDSIKEELGIVDSELAEKVASSDSSVVEYIKELSRVPVESMGDDDTRDKTASVEEEDPFGDFLATPL